MFVTTKVYQMMLPITTLVVAIVALGNGQDFAFPETTAETGEIPNKEKERVPLFIPGRCPENQLLYPGNQKTDWICDCGPSFIYYPPGDACFAAYKRGPCGLNQYLILKKNLIIPECADNPCRKDGFVIYQGTCHELNKPGGPCKNDGDIGTLSVNATTLEVECMTGLSRLSLFNFPDRCPPGSRRDNANRCRQKY